MFGKPQNAPSNVFLPFPYPNMDVCYAATWLNGVAYMNDRVCSQPNGPIQCFPHPPVPCDPDNAHCKAVGAAPLYTSCTSDGPPVRSWTSPFTVYLNDPCDLDDGEACRVASTPGH